MSETKTTDQPAVTYTIDDCGCYVDGSRGIYATDTIVDFARTHGMEFEAHDPACTADHAPTCDESEFAGCEFRGEFEDEATEYMNEQYAVTGASWGRNEQGDWGLWQEEDEDLAAWQNLSRH